MQRRLRVAATFILLLGGMPVRAQPVADPLQLQIVAAVHAAAPLAFRIDDKRFGPEGIAHDPKSKRFFLGSVTTNAWCASARLAR